MSDVVLIGGPKDGAVVSLCTDADYVCARIGSGPWHHYIRGEFNGYWYTGPCDHKHLGETDSGETKAA